MNARLLAGRGLRWYLTRARHPFKNYLVGHYWAWFCKWRVWIPYDHTSVISVCLGDYMEERIFFDGYYERPLIQWLERVLRPDDIFWDVGAHIGAVALVAGRLCGKVVAFEPDPRSFARLQLHIDRNSRNNVEMLDVALSSTTGNTDFFQSPVRNTGMSSLLEYGVGPVARITIPVLRADDLVAARPDITPTVIKLDVEGAEDMVLSGARQLLENRALRAVIFEGRCPPNGRPASGAVVDRLESAGFSITTLGRSDEQANDGLQNFLAVRSTHPV